MTVLEDLLHKCQDWRWRVRNLYVYHDQVDGGIKPFRPNEAQEHFMANRAPYSLVVKTRREGFSTYIVNETADWCIWVPGQIGALIDYKKDDAKKKLRWASLCWRHMGKYVPGLTEAEGLDFNATLRRMFPLKRGNDDPGKEEIEWANGSLYYCSTGVRGGMVNCGHVSEMGKIAAKYPDRAIEIMAGISPAAAPGNRLSLESTHEGGKYGKHWELIEKALKKVGQRYNEIEFKLLFFSFLNSNKRLPANSIKLDEEEQQIVDDYKAQGVELSADRWAYWISQYRIHKERNFCEFPIAFDDIFRSPVEGSIYGRVLYKRQLAGAVAAFPVERRWPAYVCFDIGQRDAMAMWLVQMTPWEWRWLDYYQASYRNPDHFVGVIDHWKKWCNIQNVILPHDGKKTESNSKTFSDTLSELGVQNILVLNRCASRWPGIFELRSMLEVSAFHQRIVDGYRDDTGAHICGWELLRNYRSEVVQDGKRVSTEPVHDHTSNCADAARYLAEARLAGWISPHLNPQEANAPLVILR